MPHHFKCAFLIWSKPSRSSKRDALHDGIPKKYEGTVHFVSLWRQNFCWRGNVFTMCGHRPVEFVDSCASQTRGHGTVTGGAWCSLAKPASVILEVLAICLMTQQLTNISQLLDLEIVYNWWIMNCCWRPWLLTGDYWWFMFLHSHMFQLFPLLLSII